MIYYPELDIVLEKKAKALLDFSRYVTKQKLEHAAGVDISNSAAKSEAAWLFSC